MNEITRLMANFHEGEDLATASVHKYRSLKRKVIGLGEMLNERGVSEGRKSGM